MRPRGCCSPEPWGLGNWGGKWKSRAAGGWGGDGTQVLSQAGSCAVSDVGWHGPVTSRAGLERRRKEPARGMWQGGRNGSALSHSLGSPSLPWISLPFWGPHPFLASPSFTGPHLFRGSASLPEVSVLSGVTLWSPHPSLRSLSLPRVRTPPQGPCPSPGSQCLPGVPISPWGLQPSPGSPSLPQGPHAFLGFPSFPKGLHPFRVSPSLPMVPTSPRHPHPSPGSPHLGKQQERAAGAGIGVLLPEAEEFRGEDGGGKEAEEEKPTDGEVPHLLARERDSSGLRPVVLAACGPPAPALPPALPRAAPRGTAPPPACGAA